MVSTATAATLLDAEAFNQLVLEKGLHTWETAGYIYTGFRGAEGWELYRAYGPKWKWLYQARRVLTQSNAGGGALQFNISMPAGTTGTIMALYHTGTASAGNSATAYLYDEDGAVALFIGTVAAGASRTFSLPALGAVMGNANSAVSTDLCMGPGTTLVIINSAALQTETATLYVEILMSSQTEPTWATTGSGGTPSLADSTISAANTLQAVLLP